MVNKNASNQSGGWWDGSILDPSLPAGLRLKDAPVLHLEGRFILPRKNASNQSTGSI